MQIFVVGGAVRDRLLGLPVNDRDYVVVGSTPEEMIRAGFIPIGRDFPVFLHPVTKEEYALARTERKIGKGYGGFTFHADPGVTLLEDLSRRDLTINAMAETLDGKDLIDPSHGLADLRARLFRHVGPAFAEDPVRLLRLARFSARFVDFSVAPDTLALVRQMVESGEVDALVAERVWAEVARGLMAEKPSRMLRLLGEVDALARVMPGASADEEALRALDASALANDVLPVRFAVWLVAGKLDAEAIAALCAHLHVPDDVRALALLLARLLANIGKAHTASAEELLELIEAGDALRRGERFAQLLRASARLTLVLSGSHAMDTRGHQRIERALQIVKGVDARAVTGAVAKGEARSAMRDARIRALNDGLS